MSSISFATPGLPLTRDLPLVGHFGYLCWRMAREAELDALFAFREDLRARLARMDELDIVAAAHAEAGCRSLPDESPCPSWTFRDLARACGGARC